MVGTILDGISFSQAAVILVAAAVITELIWGLRRRMMYDLHKVPGPAALPLLGHEHLLPLLLSFRGKLRITAKIHEWAQKYGKVYKLNMLLGDVLMVHDPTFVDKHIFAGSKSDIPKHFTYQGFNKIFGPYNEHSVFTSIAADAKYKSFRKTLARAFSSEALKKGFPEMLVKSKQMALRIASLSCDGASLDMQDMGVRFSLDCIGLFAFSLDFDAIGTKDHSLLECFEACSADAFTDHLNPFKEPLEKFLSLAGFGKKRQEMYDRLYHEYDKIMRAIDFEGAPPEESDQSIRAQLMRLRNPLENNRKASWSEIYAEMAMIIFAGTDTTGHQLSWILMCLATHPDVQDRVFNELVENSLAGDDPRDLDYADLRKLTYLGQVVKEALRRIPVAPSCGPRQLQHDMEILGYQVPKGTLLLCQAQTLNTSPWCFENGDKFDPDRWAAGYEVPDGFKASNASRKVCAFGFGARTCIGQRLALLELQMALAVLVSKFRFSLDPCMGGWDGCLDKGYNSVVLVCEGGLWMKAAPRTELT